MPIIVGTSATPAATPRFTEFFLNDALDPTDSLALAYVGDSYKVTRALGGGVEHDYASGRSRSWSDGSDITRVTFTATYLTTADIAWLEAHRGRTVVFRDHLGRKVFCEYQTADVDYSTMPPDSPAAIHSIPLTLESVTASEAV